MKFKTTILQGGGTKTGIEVPAEIIERLGKGKRPPVRVTINDHAYRSTVAVMGGKFMVGLSAENRALAQVAGGDQVEIGIELDSEPREVTMPADFSAALRADPDAGRAFDALSYSRKSWFVLGIEAAKKAETRSRRIVDAVEMLRNGGASPGSNKDR